MKNLLLLLFSSFTLHPSPAFAVEVQPERLEMTIPADQPTQETLEVANPSGRIVKVQIQTGPYRFFQPGLTLPSAQTWISFDPATFTLAPKASTKVRYVVTPPSSILEDTAGEYLAAILVDELPVEGGNQKGSDPIGGQTPTARITVVPRFALPVYLKIKGRERIQMEISNVSVRQPKSIGLLRVETTLNNRGTVHIRPKGTLAILGTSKNVVAASPLGKTLPLLPTATLQVPTTVPLPPPGRYTAVVTVEARPGELLQKEAAFEVTAQGDIR